MLFKDLNIIEPILKALNEKGYTVPTPIQEQGIPVLLEGKDLLGVAQTGTGKTAAFAIPILQKLYSDKKALREVPNLKIPKTIKALIVTPTRELAAQIGDSFNTYGKFTGLKKCVIFGGVSQNPQTDALRSAPDILIATPGRLLDLMNQKFINLEHIEFFVLDEADQMLDMGFIRDVRKIIASLPPKRQNMLFSATMPSEIIKLVNQLLIEPAEVSVTPASSTIDAVTQYVYFVEKLEKRKLLAHLLKDEAITSALVFARTKHGVDKIAKDLSKSRISVQSLHGDKSQQSRQIALDNFKNKKSKVMVATDIAARGIDIIELSHVINFDLPSIPETYVHRIGRTGRAGLCGVAISFCASDEKSYLKNIQKLIGKQIEIIALSHIPEPVTELKPSVKASSKQARNSDNKRRGMPSHKPRGNHKRKPSSPNNGIKLFSSSKTS